MLTLEAKTVMRLSDADLTLAEAVCFSTFALGSAAESGSGTQKAAAKTMLGALQSRKFLVERKDGATKIVFRDYDVPEVEPDFDLYSIEFFTDEANLAYIAYRGEEPILDGSWTVAELKAMTSVHMGDCCCAG